MPEKKKADQIKVKSKAAKPAAVFKPKKSFKQSDKRKSKVTKKKLSKIATSRCVILLSQPSISNQSCYIITNAPSNAGVPQGIKNATSKLFYNILLGIMLKNFI